MNLKVWCTGTLVFIVVCTYGIWYTIVVVYTVHVYTGLQ